MKKTKQLKTLTFSFLKGNAFSEEFASSYSKFKHGSKTQARFLGREVADQCLFPANSTLIVYAAPYNNVPAASNAFKDYLLEGCSEHLMNDNITIKQAKIHREYSYDDDYGLMSKEDRKKAISADQMYIDKSCINNGDILVFIDDIKITGSHEDRIKEILIREKLENECIFVYMAEYTGEDPTIEHYLNHHSVNNLKDVNRIIQNEEFIFNIRVIKYILKAELSEFVNFITYQSDTFRKTLYHLAILNKYHSHRKYYKNFNILKNLL